MRPPLGEELPEELLAEEDSPNRFKTICSLLLGLRLKVISCPLEPWLPKLRETWSPPPLAELLMSMVICSGLVLLLLLLRLRIISGPLPEAGLELEAGLVPLLLLLRLMIISGPLLEAGLVPAGLARLPLVETFFRAY